MEWKTTLAWRPPVTCQVEGQAHRCLQVTLRPVSQDVSSLIVSTCLIAYYCFVMVLFCFFFTNSSQFKIVLENCKVIFGKF